MNIGYHPSKLKHCTGISKLALLWLAIIYNEIISIFRIHAISAILLGADMKGTQNWEIDIEPPVDLLAAWVLFPMQF
jgi:hypothetical protein